MTAAFERTVRRTFGLALVFTFGLAPIHSATLERLTLDELIAKSTAIVRGKVSGAQAALRGPVVYTHYAIQVTEQLKGLSPSTVDVAVPGGIANNLRQTFPGSPKFNTGDEFVFFLWTGPSGLTQIMGLTQGIFRLAPSTSSTGGASMVATRAASTELMLEPGTGRPVKDQTLVMSLSDLKSWIASGLSPHEAQ